MRIIPQQASVVVLTGAGISVASGMPPFRGPGGLWNDEELAELVTTEALRRQPARVLKFLSDLRAMARAAQPNAAHYALSKAEKARSNSARFTVITQNIDNLHQRAGSRRVCEIHGSLEFNRCEACQSRFSFDEASVCTCGATLRPDVVLFGELLPADAVEEAQQALETCDYFVAVGTSGVVWPAAAYVVEARAAGAHCINVNVEPSHNAAFHEEIQGRAEDVLPQLFGVER